MNYSAATLVRPASQKQLKMIIALAWQLRPYYLFAEWSEIRTKLLQLLTQANMQKCHQLIKRMLSVLHEKQKQKKVWMPMSYRLDNPVWQENLTRMASFLFSEEESDDPEEESGEPPTDLKEWRELKNRIEREELRRSYEFVSDEFEKDDRAAVDEEQRWKLDKRPYAEVIQGIDWLEPVPGIDY